MQRRHILLGLAGLPLISSCEYLHNRSDLDWTEDVLLPDGRVVTLKRHQEFKGGHEIGEDPTESNYWFEFANPNNGEQIKWEQNDSPHNLSGLVLFFEEGACYILTTPRFFAGLIKYNYPNPPYLLFKYNKNTWEMVPLDKIPIKTLRVNMSYDIKKIRSDIKEKGWHLSSEITLNSYYRGSALPYLINFNKQKTPQVFGVGNRRIGIDFLVEGFN